MLWPGGGSRRGRLRCVATSGPGAIHLLNGLYDAKLDQAPVLAITGMPFHDLIGTHTQQDVETDKLFMDVAKYSMRIMGPTHVENVADLACRTSLAYRGVTHIAFPVDLQEQEVKGWRTNKRNVPHHTSDAFARSARLPDEHELARAAEVLNAGKKVMILAGQGALHAGDPLERAADTLASPIAKALLGKAAVPDDSPYTTGPIGLLGTRPSQEAMEECDTLLIVGSSFPYIEFLPKPGQARGVQIELDPMRIGLRYPVEVGLVGDSARTLEALLPRLTRKTDRMLMAELATCVKYRLPVKVFIVKNDALGMIKWEQMVFLGNPEYGCDLQPIDFALFARAVGAAGYTVEDPGDCGRVIEQALATPGPVVVQGVVDPFEPPLPGKITVEQAAKFAQSLLRGEPNRDKIAWTVLRERVREMV